MPQEQDFLYSVHDLPVARGAVVLKALERYDQQQLLQVMGARTAFTPRQLLPVVARAMQQGHVHAFRIRTPPGQILSMVDLQNFQQQMDAFVRTVMPHEAQTLHSEIAGVTKEEQSEADRRVKHLGEQEGDAKSIDDYFRLAQVSVFAPMQLGFEFLSLLRLLSGRRPRCLLEIGSAYGGTLYLFTKIAADDAILATVDLQITNERSFVSFARQSQHVFALQGDSTDASIKNTLEEIFASGLDFLFLDGDHSYEGVKTDFQNLSALVRPGGIIAFHDIVESYDARFGVLTETSVGGVPRFWSEIKQHYEHREFVEHPLQDGFGIGVLFK